MCGTDVHEYLAGPILLPGHGITNEHTGATVPLIMGHEFSGTVREVGNDVKGISVGQAIAVNPSMSCQHHGHKPCVVCEAGRPNVCLRSTFYGLHAQGGGFADEICVDQLAVVPLPETVPLKLAALAEPLSVAAHMVRISGFEAGQSAVVLGAGPIGCALILFLRDRGAKSILVSEVAASRVEQAKACGADRVVDPTQSKTAVSDAVQEVMAPGADVAFDACGIQATLDEAFNITKPGGTVFNVAIHEKPLSLNLNNVTLHEKRLMGGNAYTREDFEYVVRYIADHAELVESFISAIVPLESAVDGAFAELVRNKVAHNKILVQVAGDGEKARL